MAFQLPYRQIHLDFHTSPDIPDIGADFDPVEFADTLARAHVNSVTAFARCHHGLLYYESQQHPERVHPHLVRRNLLPEQIEACHRRGIRVPIYTTVQWDDYSADRHRDWLCLDETGREYGTGPFEAGFYRNLDVLHPEYRQFLKDHVAEIFRLMPVDGLFFDIVLVRPSVAMHWLDAMDNSGFDPEDAGDRARFAQKVVDDWKLEMTEFVRSQPGYHDACTIFYNAGHVGPSIRASAPAYSHFELESLPSGGWGYLHFPVAQRYARGLGKPTLGMTGKFHTSWGDFHSYKNQAALEFECFHMLALGAHVSVGDQLHPRGRLDPFTYDLIGNVYDRVEGAEPWCTGAVPQAEIGLLTPEEFPPKGQTMHHNTLPDAIFGAVRMLQETHAQFDIVTSDRDLAAYRLLILPDAVPVNEALAAKLDAFLASGGSLIASYQSGLRPDGSDFALPAFGVSKVDAAPFSPDFLVPGEALLRAVPGLQQTGYVMYQRGLQVVPLADSMVLAEVETPYFNRTWRHFCSHRHTPSAQTPGYPGAVRRGRVIYFSHPIFSTYQANAALWCRRLLEGALDLLAPDRLVMTDAPSSLIAALTQQAAEGRQVLHVLHYVPERRGSAFDVIEDVFPLHHVKLAVKPVGHVSAVRCVPEGAALPFTVEGGYVHFSLPELNGYQIIEIA